MHWPPTQLRPTQQGFDELQTWASERQVVLVVVVHTPPEQARPGQHGEVPHGQPALRQLVVGATQEPPLQVRPKQHGAVLEQVAPVVRHCCA